MAWCSVKKAQANFIFYLYYCNILFAESKTVKLKTLELSVLENNTEHRRSYLQEQLLFYLITSFHLYPE